MIKQKRQYKIALVGDCLASGGAEKVHALLSLHFSKLGFDVHNCIFLDWIAYEYGGSLLNLGKINPASKSIPSKISRFLALRKFIRTNEFDFVIDFRMRTNFPLEFLLSKTAYPKNTFYTIHSGILEFYIPKSKFLANLIYRNRKLVAVSKAIEKTVSGLNLQSSLFQIYNPIDVNRIKSLENETSGIGKYILAAGSMSNDIKQFDQLIAAYAKSSLPEKEINLVILGDGENKLAYEKLARDLGLGSRIIFSGFVENPFPYYKNALFFVLSSKNEGFPNVISESLACATPVVSFDCMSGPNEIIRNRENGLLVADQDFAKLISAMEEMAFDEKLYYHCKENAAKSAQPFDIETIGAQWLELMKIN